MTQYNDLTDEETVILQQLKTSFYNSKFTTRNAIDNGIDFNHHFILKLKSKGYIKRVCKVRDETRSLVTLWKVV